MPYDLINVEFSARTPDNKLVGGVFFLPTLLSRYMIFKESDPLIFKNRWRLKKYSLFNFELQSNNL